MNIFKEKESKKIILEEEKLLKLCSSLRENLGLKLVITIGTWDLLHIGHVRYLKKAKESGDILIVGADSDRSVKLYKGELRPVVPQDERMEMLCYQSCVDFVTLVDDVEKETGWQYGLIKSIRPDTFVAVKDSYPDSQITEINKYCDNLIILPRQADNTSTSAFIKKAINGHLNKFLEELR